MSVSVSKMLKLQSSDGVTVEVDEDVIRVSETIKTMLDTGVGDDKDDIIPVANVSVDVLKKVIEWAIHHKDDPPPLEEDDTKEKRTDDISNWDCDFLKVERSVLYELILAANFLDIKGLLDLTCKTVAIMIKGKTAEEIRKEFNIQHDLTPEEESQIRKENEWCEEK